jgi:hypothetical protein
MFTCLFLDTAKIIYGNVPKNHKTFRYPQHRKHTLTIRRWTGRRGSSIGYRSYDGSDLFDGEGIVKIMPGRHFKIEEYRVNLGQVQNYIDRRQAQVLFLDRLFQFDSEATG